MISPGWKFFCKQCNNSVGATVRNVRLDIRWGAGDPETNRKRAEEIVALAPAIIVAFGSSAVAAFLQATRSVPVVFAGVIDPVSAGYVAGLGAARWQRYRLFVV